MIIIIIYNIYNFEERARSSQPRGCHFLPSNMASRGRVVLAMSNTSQAVPCPAALQCLFGFAKKTLVLVWVLVFGCENGIFECRFRWFMRFDGVSSILVSFMFRHTLVTCSFSCSGYTQQPTAVKEWAVCSPLHWA